jgi:tetratricopeptide (TPR) repeat protein
MSAINKDEVDGGASRSTLDASATAAAASCSSSSGSSSSLMSEKRSRRSIDSNIENNDTAGLTTDHHQSSSSFSVLQNMLSQPQQQQSKNPPSMPSKQHHHHQQQPFFVLDGWLEDLMLEHRQPSATLPIEQEQQQQEEKQLSSPPPLSPLLRLLPWIQKRDKATTITMRNDSRAVVQKTDLQQQEQKKTILHRSSSSNNTTPSSSPAISTRSSRSSCSSSSTSPSCCHDNDDDDDAFLSSPTSCLTMPLTPKSSNRRRRLVLPKNKNNADNSSNSNNSARHRQGTERYKDGLPKPLYLLDQLDRAMNANDVLRQHQHVGDVEEEEQQQEQSMLLLQERIRRKQQRQQEKRKTQCIVQRSIALAQAWNNKGLQRAQNEQWLEAVACWDNSLEIYTSLFGSNHIEVANIQNNRGIALGRMKNVKDALHALEHAHMIRTDQYHKQKSLCSTFDATSTTSTNIPLLLISSLHNIANVHQQSGDLVMALSVFGQAKQKVLTILDELQQQQDQRRRGCPHPQQHEALRMMRMVVYQLHHQSARLCTSMGHVYYDVQQWEDANDAYHDALHIYEYLVYNDDGYSSLGRKQHPQHAVVNVDDDESELYENAVVVDPELKTIVIQELIHLKKDIYELDKTRDTARRKQQVHVREEQSELMIVRSSLYSSSPSLMVFNQRSLIRCTVDHHDDEQQRQRHNENFSSSSLIHDYDDIIQESCYPIHHHRQQKREPQQDAFLMIPPLTTAPFSRG